MSPKLLKITLTNCKYKLTKNTCFSYYVVRKAGVFVRNSRNNGKFIIVISIIIVFSIVAVSVYSYLSVRGIIINYAKSYAQTIALDTVNRTVTQHLSNKGIDYNSIVKLSKNGDDNITSLEIDIAKINYLKSVISLAVSEELTGKEDYRLSIPLGNLIGNEYLIGFGPKIKFNMKMTTTVVTDFESKFYSAGINQVLHQIIIKIKINGSFVLPWDTGGFTEQTSIIAAQTVLVGVTPDAYTNVMENYGDGDEGHTVGNIFDYGAQLP